MPVAFTTFRIDPLLTGSVINSAAAERSWKKNQNAPTIASTTIADIEVERLLRKIFWVSALILFAFLSTP